MGGRREQGTRNGWCHLERRPPVLGEPDYLGKGRGQKVRVGDAPRMGGCGFEGVDLGPLALDCV